MNVAYRIGIAVSFAAVLSACSAGASTAPAHTTAPPAAGSAASSTGAPSPFPTGDPVPAGPLGGNYCAVSSAYWIAKDGTVLVAVQAPGPAQLTVTVVDTNDNDLAPIAAGQIDGTADSTTVTVNVPDISQVAGVDLAVAGYKVLGTCVVPKS